VAQGAEFRANSYTTNSQSLPFAAMDDDGDFLVAWTSTGQDGSLDGVYAQRYNAAGMAQDGEFRVNTHTTDDQWAPSVSMDADGDFVVAWASYYQDGSDAGVYAQRYQTSSALGDFDDDGDVDAADIDILWHIIRGSGSDPNADDSPNLNGDGFANEDDVDYHLANLLTAGTGRRYGDADVDGDVDGADFDLWRTRPGYSGAGTGKWASGDFDGDRDVDGADFDLWRTRPTQYPTQVGPHAALVSGQWTVSIVPGTAMVSGEEARSGESDRGVAVGAELTNAAKSPSVPSVGHYSSFDVASPMWRSRHLGRWVAEAAAEEVFGEWVARVGR
jgi:hypothetical protein